MKRRPPSPSQRGMTLTELLFVLAMSGVLLLSIVTFTRDTRFGLMRSELSSELALRSRVINSNLRVSVASNDIILARSGLGTYDALRTLVKNSVTAVSGTPVPVAFSLSPVIQNSSEAQLSPITSATAVNWGNELMFIVNLPPLTVTACYAQCPPITTTSATVQERVSIDRLQMVYIYLAQDPGASVPNLPGGGLRLVEWRSSPLLSYEVLASFNSPRLTGTVKAAMAEGYTWAFNKSAAATPATAFYKLTSSLVTPLDNSTGAPATLGRSHWAYMDEYDLNANPKPLPGVDRGRIRIRMGGGQIAGPSDVAVALNTYQPTVNPNWKAVTLLGAGKDYQVPLYASPDYGSANFPGGFEVSIWGKPNARQIEARLVLMGTSGYNPRAPAKTYMALESMQSMAVKNE